MARWGSHLIVDPTYAYSVKRIGSFTFRVVKFDELFNPLFPRNGWHTVNRTVKGNWTCTCGAYGGTCRHRITARIALQLGRVDSGWFYDYDAGAWRPPLNLNVRVKTFAK